ncbi:ATP-dependent helicase [Aeromicrobium sp. 636]|uniref:DEAD/DEAH box helicase n=1 Tax=Aeromicrobium senzhongii TaxID=2663859 RepID=A0A8I0K1V3_9ACTN|nr:MULTISPECIES: DEAD/DEAH box helicase [Aeromicrobium]MBC9225369.1 DEAD/DEAH box helicase [Aeromicrobium senzhongii]MCQ3997479.1 ATP-dependent helicase [Aeromicrobium sp. 636]MTB87407.1 ATP-dependent helicase [Aeromicrobium senzhongii]QNL95536.1 DEAD/DEAH box helicase [Aeromicrobium senzhongii]
MPTPTELQIALRHPVRFVSDPDDPSRSRFVFDTPRGPLEATANEAVGPLSGGIRALSADASARAWATPAIIALRLMATGTLASPDPSQLQQMLNSARAVGPTEAEGQTAIRAFLAALVAAAPAVATTPQRRRETEQPRPTIERPTSFSYRLVVTLSGDADAMADVEVHVRPQAMNRASVPAPTVLTRDDHHLGPAAKPALRAMLERLAAAWPPAERLADEGRARVTPEELGLLGQGRPLVSALANRIEIEWPEGLRHDVRATGVISRIDTDESPLDREHDRPRAFTADQLFRFDWSVSVGGEHLSRAEVEQLAASQSGMLHLRDRWVMVDQQQVERVLAGHGRTLDPSEALRAAITGSLEIDGYETEVDTVGWLEDVRRRLAEQDSDITPAAQPGALDGQLREYQLRGLRWMSQLVDLGLGGILADDMGLGKTLMLIALHLHLDSPEPTLVVCPASVLATWEREITRFAPGVPVSRYHGPRRSLSDAKSGFVVTTYATMRSSVEELAAHRWNLVVADEAQHVKNPGSGAAQALRRIDSDARMALTGTPVENHLGELWALLDWTTPGLLGTREQFRREWSRQIERDHDAERAAGLSQLIRPFVLRRRKSDPGIAPELPPKIETDHRVPLSREQVGLYEAVVQRTMSEIADSSGIRRRGLVVKLLTQLKQICNHPAQFLHEPEARLAGRSGKLETFDSLVEEIIDEDGAALVFTQYAQMGRLLARRLGERKVRHDFLHGGTPVARREKMVRAFQDGETDVFVLSLKAAGTGLNLTRADHVVHYDRWWNPAVEDQATDRAHRIGQTRNVQVHRLVAEGTIEESIAELISSKRALADAVVNAGETALTELTDSELEVLVQLRH